MKDKEKEGFDLYIIADYGIGDPAFTEVKARFRAENRRNGDIISSIYDVSVAPFSTISTGFWIRQLGLEDGYPGAVIFSNTAPRGNTDEITWEGDEKQRLLYGVLRNGVQVFAVSAGYNWSFIRDELVAFHDLDIPNIGSQFRSRDIYAPAAIRFLAGDRSFLGEEIDPNKIPEVPSGLIAHVDGYGNVKTTYIGEHLDGLNEHPFLEAVVGGVKHTLFNHLAGNPAPVGRIGLLEGSSGGAGNRFLELVLRGGSAYKTFDCPLISDSRQVEFHSVH